MEADCAVQRYGSSQAIYKLFIHERNIAQMLNKVELKFLVSLAHKAIPFYQ